MRVICVVDDAVQRSSPYWGEHGLAFLIEAEGRRVLFDTGQSGTVLLHNLRLLGVDPQTVDALAISHAHYDHIGGLPTLLEHLSQGTVLYANPDLFRERFSRREGQVKSIGFSLTQETLATRLTLKLDARPQEILPGLWTTGEILDRPQAEGKSNYHLMREGKALVADAYRDDMSLVLTVGDSLVLLCGCCHAGLLNTLAHVQQTFERPIATIAGGLHLTSATTQDLQYIVQVLTAMPALRRVYPNHCSGETAFVALTEILGSAVVHPCPVGTTLEF